MIMENRAPVCEKWSQSFGIMASYIFWDQVAKM